MKARPYQAEAIASIFDWFAAGHDAPLIVLPTGAGKSFVLADFIRQAITSFPDTRILVVTHVKELVEQDAAAIRKVWPHASVGIYSAGLGLRQFKPITVASIQSIYKREAFYGRFDLIIVDEAHLIPHASTGMYRRLLEKSAQANPDVKLIGLTATPYRLDSGVLHQGDGAMFDGISYEANVADLIAAGYLCPLTAQHGANVDLSGVRMVGGEFNLGQLGERMAAMELVQHHADLIIERCADRNAWLIFCVTVQHASAVSAALRVRGIPAAYVSGETPNDERDQIITDFKAGKLRALVNCNILTTGFDHPATDAVVMLRPTMSPGLYVQMVGRGLRLHESKTNCLVLDFGGNVKRHGFIDAVEPPRKGKKGEPQEAPVKECPDCHRLVAISLQVCECGHEFEIAPRTNEKEAHVGVMLAAEIKPVELDVLRVYYSRHVGKSGVPTLRVDYQCGLRTVTEYVCIEHAGYARSKAIAWWGRRCSDLFGPVPDSVDDAIDLVDQLLTPERIVVSFATKYPEIKRHCFALSDETLTT
jgi:DNA repair protein RadD